MVYPSIAPINISVTFSIIIASYNSASTIADTLESILNQSFKDIEIIIIDNKSEDNTLTIIDKIKRNNENIKVYVARDKGIYDAMNMGIKYASGKWLYFLGSDDVLYDSKVLEDIYLIVDLDEYDFIYGNVKFLHSSKIYAGAFSLERLLLGCNICHQAIFYKKRIFDILDSFNLRYKVWADWDFNIRCFKHSELRIKYIDRLVAIYNERDGLSGKNPMDEELIKELPLFYANKNRENERKIESLMKSKDYRVGSFLLRPLRKIKKVLSALF